MAVRILDDSADIDITRLEISRMVVKRVDAVGDLLDASHDLLMRVFDAAVVDAKEVYIDAVTDHSGTFRDFSPVFLAAVFQEGEDEFVAGFISSDVMLVGTSLTKTQLAIGNIATSPRLKNLGFRGVGSTLWRAALKTAEQEVGKTQKRLNYSTSEAEPASLPFWAKLGYRCPEGIKYFQPPLEFDDNGDPVYDEVPETLLLHPLEDASDSIDVADLRNIVKSIYWNWGIRPSLHKLNADALASATRYVMEEVFERTIRSFPSSGKVRLVDVPKVPVH